jgi:hypothetical protein
VVGRPRVLSVALAALAFTLAGCGGSSPSSSTTSSSNTTTTSSPAAAKAAVRKAWIQFFAGATSADKKISLLQNGERFADAIKAQASSPLAKQTSATVSSVTLQGSQRAKVVYTIALAGTPALKNQKGTAVKVGGSWKVGDASFCSLLALQGSPPKACSQAG